MNIAVIGGGAAGMLAAIAAADSNTSVTIYEKNEKLGKKLFITGKGRCNLTNACENEELFDNITGNPKFMYSAINAFDNHDIMELMQNAGCMIKIERGNRVFPVSDHSSDVIAALQRLLRQKNVNIRLNTKVNNLDISEDKRIRGIILESGEHIPADSVILATGGASYPSTGSTGDGYRFANKSGHRIVETKPSLVPFECREEYCHELMGLSLKNVNLKLIDGKKTLYEGFGEMLFTHFGISGPLVLTASSFYHNKKGGNVKVLIDLKPALSMEVLDKRFLRELSDNGNKAFKNSLNALYPSKLIPVIIELSGIEPDKKANSVTKEERLRLVDITKHLEFTVMGTRSYDEAIITKGGVSVKDINPSTMESRLIQGLYFAGEIIDVDALTGGFNLQIAWSTGYLAGKSAIKTKEKNI